MKCYKSKKKHTDEIKICLCVGCGFNETPDKMLLCPECTEIKKGYSWGDESHVNYCDE